MKHTTISAVLGAILYTGSASAATLSFDGTTDQDIVDASNWTTDALPTTGTHTGVVGTGQNVTFTNRSLYDDGSTGLGMTITFEGTSTLKNGQNAAVRLGSAVYTFNDSSSFSNFGANSSADNLIIGYNGEGATINWNTVGALVGISNFELGQDGTSFFNQNGGSVSVENNFDLTDGVYTLSAGDLSIPGLVIAVNGALDFTTNSTGLVTSSSTVDFASLINSGQITINGSSATVADFTITDTTLALAVPEPSSTALLGLGGLALVLRRRK
ncbi:PEP-CTERM sorting domain-containing protein [Oceaniferula spumae]